jgi:hypothetical protein
MGCDVEMANPMRALAATDRPLPTSLSRSSLPLYALAFFRRAKDQPPPPV